MIERRPAELASISPRALPPERSRMASTALAQRPRAPLRELRVPQCLTGRRETAPREARHLAFAPRSLRLRHKSRASHARPLCLWPPSARTQWRRGGSCSSTQPDDRVATNTIARSSAWRATPLSPKHSRLAVVAEAKSDGGRGLRVAWLRGPALSRNTASVGGWLRPREVKRPLLRCQRACLPVAS